MIPNLNQRPIKLGEAKVTGTTVSIPQDAVIVTKEQLVGMIDTNKKIIEIRTAQNVQYQALLDQLPKEEEVK